MRPHLNYSFSIIFNIILLLFTFFFSSCQKEESSYYCPMHPDYTSERPGDCPICGMKLVPHKKEKPSSENQRHLSHDDNHTLLDKSSHDDKNPHSRESPHDEKNPHSGNFPHDDKNPHTGNFPQDDTSPTFDNPSFQKQLSGKTFTISSEEQKTIGVKTSLVKYKEMESSLTSSGQVVYDTDLYTALVEYREALHLGGSVDSGFYQSAKRKLLRLGLHDSDIRIWSGKNPEIFLSGRNGKNAYIFTQVFERDLRHLKKGKKVTVKANSYPGEIFQGTIIGWMKVLDEKNRSTQAWIEVSDPKEKLTSRMFTETELNIPLGKVIVIPRSAVMYTGKKEIVYIKTGLDTFRPVVVTVGQENNSYVQILSGLEEGDEIVVGANFLIDSEARMQLGSDL